MDMKEVDKFDDLILLAFKKKYEDSNERAIELERALNVKETELDYVSRAYQENEIKCNQVLETASNTIANLETQLNEFREDCSIKGGEINQLNSELNELKSKLNFTEENNNELETQLIETKKDLGELKDVKINYDELLKEIGQLKSQFEQLTTQNIELNDLLKQKEQDIQQLSESLTENKKSLEEKSTRLMEVEMELQELKPPEPADFTSEERLICPKCGATGKDIKTEEDKTKVLSYIGNKPMYQKIKICKKCGQHI